jgi:hypothetical protein
LPNKDENLGERKVKRQIGIEMNSFICERPLKKPGRTNLAILEVLNFKH